MVGRTTLQAAILPAAIVAAAATQTLGQWVQQSYELEAGWNSVFLEVDPEPSDADLLFAGQPIEIVWRRMGVRLRSRASASASADVRSSDWRVWLPPSNPDSAVNTLRVIRGGHVYLIRATGSATLTITGRPSGAVTQWRQGPNLVGLHVVDDPDGTPTFSDYLSASPVHSALRSCVGGAQPGVLCLDDAACAGELGVCSGSFCTGGAEPGSSCNADGDCDDIPDGTCRLIAPTRVFETQSDGSLSEIADVQTAKVAPGRGFWVTADADGTYDGPIAIDESALGGLEFGKRSARAQVKFENLSDSQRLLTLTYSSSAAVPAQPADLPSLAGDTPLLWLDRVEGPIEEAFQWQTLTHVGVPLDAAGGLGARQAIQFSVRRAGLAPATVDMHGHGAQYQAIVTIADEELGFRRHIGVTTEVEGPTAAVLASRGGAQGGDTLPALPGLYVGRASVNRVAWVAAGARQVADRGFPETGEDDLRCHGGPQDGGGCVDDLDCAALGACLGGAEPGRNCDEDGHCPGEAGACVGSVCVDGAEPGKPCGEQVGCESIAAGVCEKSEADGACGSAFSDPEIPGVCHGGINDGDPCINQSECPGDAGLCSESVCEGGTEPGSECTEDTDCEDVADGMCGPLPDDATTPRATASEFSFPILIHLSDGGDFKLLTQTTLLYAPGDPKNPDDSGHYVLATPGCDPEICDPLEGGSIIDGRPFARRISTAAFAFDGDLTLEAETSGLSCSITMPEDHRLNPFRHKFHPDHDSFDKFGDFQAGESYAFTRELTFTFEAEPPPGEFASDWGYEIFGGVYEETIEGIHREPIRVDGRFKVHRISDIGQLNDGQGGGK